MREGLTQVVHIWWVRRRYIKARRHLEAVERAWQKVGVDQPPYTGRYVQALNAEFYWRERLRRMLR